MIWLVGNRGMLGRDVASLFEARGWETVGTDAELDVTDREALRDFAAGRNPGWIVNCAAYTAVDRAEEEEPLARRVNGDAPGHLAGIAREKQARLIHVSTDYVFNGQKQTPYTEDDPVDPRSAYGRTKAAGERAVQERCPAHFILRTAWLYGRHGGNFVHTMLRLMAERDEIGVVADQQGSPTLTLDLAGVIATIITQDSRRFGVYHVSNEGACTWFDFATAIRDLGLAAGLLTRRCEIRPLTTQEYPTPAARPQSSLLSKNKIRETFGVEIRDWRAALRHYLNEVLPHENP